MSFWGAAPGSDGSVKWHAKWIWIAGAPRPVNFYLFARKVFDLKGLPRNAVIRCSADSRYKLYVNGKYIGRGPARSLPAWQSFDTYDVTAALRRGRNTIGFIVHHFGEATGSYVPGRGGLICQLETDRKGDEELVVTDETWRVTRSEAWTQDGVRMGAYLGFQEVYDARLSVGDWTANNYDDSGWQMPEVIGKPPAGPWRNLEPRAGQVYHESSVLPAALVWARENDGSTDLIPEEIPAAMATESLSPLEGRCVEDSANLLTRSPKPAVIKCPRAKGVSLLFDFGKQVFGTLELRLKGAGEGIVDIGYAEALDGERLARRSGDVLCADRYTMRRGRQVWHSFEPRSFRFLQLDFRGCDGQVAIDRVQVQQISYETGRAGAFECSDSRLNRIWEVGVRTLKLCAEDALINSPRRERRTTWTDLYFAARGAYFALGDSALLESALRQGVRSQRDDGSLPAWVPSSSDEVDPFASLFFVWCAAEHYSQTGDRDLLNETLGATEKLLRWFSRRIAEDGLLSDVNGQDAGVEDCGLNCLYRETLRRSARLAESAGRPDLARAYRDASDEIRLAINKFLWAGRLALYADGRIERQQSERFSRESNVLALAAGVPDHYQRAALIRQLGSDEGDLPPIESPLYASLLVEALCKAGQYEDAARLIREGWGHMTGSGSFWESLDGSGALCRAFAVGPVADLCEHVLGAVPRRGDALQVAPHPAGLAWARGTVPTPKGDMGIEWKSQRVGFSMKLSVPAGLEVEVVSPIVQAGAVMTVDGDELLGPVANVGDGEHSVQIIVRRPAQTTPPRRRKQPDLTTTEPAKAADEGPARWVSLRPRVGRPRRPQSRASAEARPKTDQRSQTSRRRRQSSAKPEESASAQQVSETPNEKSGSIRPTRCSRSTSVEHQPNGEAAERSTQRSRRGRSAPQSDEGSKPPTAQP